MTSRRKRIAVLGAGISGLGAVLALQDQYDVVLFEASDRLGGHILPVPVADGENTVYLDTGFTGYSPRSYPRVTALLERLGVPGTTAIFRVGYWDRITDTSYLLYDFPKYCGKQFAEEAGRDLRRLIALLTRVGDDPSRLRSDRRTVFTYLRDLGYHEDLLQGLVSPALTVVWGFQPAEIAAMSAYAALSLLRRTIFVDSATEFMRVVPSSKAYLDALLAELRCVIRLRAPVRRVAVEPRAVRIGGEGFDEVFEGAVMALPPWNAFEALARPTSAQSSLLKPLVPNHTLAVVHHDVDVVPAAHRGDGAFLVTRWGPSEQPALTATWDLQRFQGIVAKRPLLVTMGDQRILSDKLVHPDRIDAVIRHRHVAMTPAYAETDGNARRLDEGTLVFSGAYLGPIGSHECAYVASIDAADRLRERLAQIEEVGSELQH